MNIEEIRTYCLSLPGVSEDVKWGKDLCFVVAEKMFCVVPLEGEFNAGFKVTPEDFDELVGSTAIIGAPYMARNKWIMVMDPDRFTAQQWKHYIKQSYDLVVSKLPQKIRSALQ